MILSLVLNLLAGTFLGVGIGNLIRLGRNYEAALVIGFVLFIASGVVRLETLIRRGSSK